MSFSCGGASARGRRKLLIGVDRLDYSKGLPQRLRAFRELLQRHPEISNSATLIQIASPSRETVLVNPYDTEATANAIQLALQMPLDERRTRHQALMDTIRRYDVHWWCSVFLDTLAETESRVSGTPWLRL